MSQQGGGYWVASASRQACHCRWPAAWGRAAQTETPGPWWFRTTEKFSRVSPAITLQPRGHALVGRSCCTWAPAAPLRQCPRAHTSAPRRCSTRATLMPPPPQTAAPGRSAACAWGLRGRWWSPRSRAGLSVRVISGAGAAPDLVEAGPHTARPGRESATSRASRATIFRSSPGRPGSPPGRNAQVGLGHEKTP